MVTPRVTPSIAFNSADPLPNPPPNTLPQSGRFYDAPLRFTGESTYYGSGDQPIVVGIVYPGEEREKRLSNGERFYDFPLPASPGPAVVQVVHGWIADGATHADTYQFAVYILTSPS